MAEPLRLIITYPALVSLVAGSALMLILEDRRIVLLPLLIQYLLLGPLIGSQLYSPVTAVRVGLGLAICIVLYITAAHLERELRELPPLSVGEERRWRSRLTFALGLHELSGMRVSFRLALVALGGLATYGLWHAFAPPNIPSEISFISYWLMSFGLLTTITVREPLRLGFGLLTFLNGFESLYLFFEEGLLVITFLGLVDLGICLSIVTCAETWLDSLMREIRE
ncbi:MAG: hypothetical protein A2Y73_02785 [Chloroflexi bacterium RBG_13_56_8]|nr:MAG: hypothetical protein A2Y73_02785 [Chloroflexi bacterium RBG_13_56_8]